MEKRDRVVPLPAMPESAWESPFLQRVLSVFAARSEAPAPFFFGAAVWAAGLAVGHHVALRYGLALRLNFFVALIGPTGVKKTSAIEPLTRLLRHVAPDVVQLYGASTAEGLLQVMGKQPSTVASVIENELAVYLAKTKSRDSILMPMSCRLFDGPPRVDLPTRADPIVAENPMFSMIGASTRAAIENQIGEAEQLGGLLNRFCFFAGERQPPIPFPGGASDSEWDALVGELADVRDNYGSVTWLEIRDPEARRLWEEYYHGVYERQARLPEIICGLTSREHVHVMKFAMMFCVLRGGREIIAEDIGRAVELGAYQFAVIESVVAPIGQGAASRLDARIEEFLSERAMTRRELHQRLSGRVKSRDLNSALATLLDLDRIAELDGGLLAWTDAEYFQRRRAGAA